MQSPAQRVLTANDLERMTDEQIVEMSWRAGRLRWKLKPHQQEVYDKYRAWELEPANDNGELPHMFVLDIGRRWGKTFLCCTFKLEDCIRHAGSVHTYATAYGKDIGEIICPLIERICADAPEDIRPTFHRSKEGAQMGYYFPNGSVLRLVGIDTHPDGLRGRASDGFVVSEAGYVRGLERTIRSIVYPQFQQRPHARLILESSAPDEIDHDFDRVFIPDAKLRNAYHFGTIDDNTALDPAEKAVFIKAAGGRGHPTCELEYFGKRIRNPKRTVVPTFDEALHVQELPVPKWAHCYVSADPGFRDLFALLFGYWDYERACLVIQADWAERNAGTADVVAVLQRTETELWADLRYGDGDKTFANPYRRTSDIALQLIWDLSQVHGIDFTPARKDDKEAALNAIRDAFAVGKIIIHPRCKLLIAHLNAARWNASRTDYERTEQFGHFDLVDALVYMWRGLDRHVSPVPTLLPDVPWELVGKPPGWQQPQTRQFAALQSIGPAKRFR